MPFLQRRCNGAFGDHIFSLLWEKIWKKRTLGTQNSAYARKTIRSVVRFFVTLAVKERPSGGVLASFLSLAPPQAAGLVHCAARPLQTANAALVCCLVPFLSCQKACRGGRPCPPDRAEGAETFSGFTRSAVFYSDAVTVPSATISFPSCGKRYGRKGRWRTK